MLLPRPKLDRILVVLDRDHLEADPPGGSALSSRALSFAKKVGADIEFFHVCEDAALGQKLLLSDVSVVEEREKIADYFATRLSEMTLALPGHGVSVTQEVRWDSPEVDAILRRIGEIKPDLVMLSSQDHAYLLGLISHRDWEIVRQSPVPVWFVSDNITDLNKIIAAIGTSSPDEEIIAGVDYSVARIADTVADAFDAEYFPVHAYQVPETMAAYAAYGPIIGGTSTAPQAAALQEQSDECRRVAQEHGERLETFADYLDIDVSSIRVERGNPAKVVPEIAASLDADAIVMGARSLSRWQRAVKQVTAEPVLARSKCDVIFAKRLDYSEIPVSQERPIPGKPVMDVEAAIVRPDTVFESPAAVVKQSELSHPLRMHILEAWEQDIRANMMMQEEGGMSGSADLDTLKHVQAAVKELAKEKPRKQEGIWESIAKASTTYV